MDQMATAHVELEPYLYFNGRCEAALTHYADVFGGSVASMMRFKDAPEPPDLPEAELNQIMHASFQSSSMKFMASDGMPGSPRSSGGQIIMSLSLDDLEAARQIFDKLAAGGTVTMPLQKTFWGAMFGMLTDAFGIDWMLNIRQAA